MPVFEARRHPEIWLRQGCPEMVTFICKFCCKCNEKVPRQDGTSFRGSQICPDERPDGARRDGELWALQWQQHQPGRPDEHPHCAYCHGGGGIYNCNNTNRNTQTNAKMAQRVIGTVGATMATTPTVVINSKSARSAKTAFDDRHTGRRRNNNGPTFRCPQN